MAHITDGIINEKIFKNEKTKLLWILKEPHADESYGNWDLCYFLRKRSEKGELFSYPRWKASLGLVCKISWGILEPEKSFIEINEYDDKKLANILDRVALINIKKEPGGRAAKYKEIKDAYKKNFNVLENQIEDIQPNIIFCGSTFQFFLNQDKKYRYPSLSEVENFDLYETWPCVDSNNTIWINGWHPNQTVITHEEYFDEVRKALYNKNS